MVAAMKELIAQVEALPEAEQAELAELLLAALRARASASAAGDGEAVNAATRSVIDAVAARHFDALSQLA